MPSAIEWTGETWNPVTGCTKVSPACSSCYIERQTPMRIAGREFVKGHIPLEFHENRLVAPLRRRKPTVYFVNSMSDLFHDDVPDEFIDRVFAVMALSPWHTYQVLTKRADRMCTYLSGLTFERLRFWMNERSPTGEPLKRQTPAGGFVPTGAENLCSVARRSKERVYRLNPHEMPLRTPMPPFPNVWVGCSVENQHFANLRIPLLRQTPAAVRFLSCEPLLGPVDLDGEWLTHACTGVPFSKYDNAANTCRVCRSRRDTQHRGIDWVIAGGESGPKVRPSDPAWFRSLRDQCVAAGVPFFFKQWGGRTPKSGGRELDGRTWDQMPEART